MKYSSKQRGGTLVEFAIVLPLFVLIMFVIVEAARVLQIYQTITNAAREGARYSVAPYQGTNTLPTSSDVQAYVCAYLSSGAINCGGTQPATVTVSQSVSNSFNGVPTTFTRVDVSTPYQFKFLRFANITLTTRAVMRNENNASP